MTNVTASGVNATYAYDADGHRVKQSLGSAVTNYLWDEASPYRDVVYEYNGSGATLASYVLGENQLISQTRGSTTSYYLQEGQGSTRALTNSSDGARVGETGGAYALSALSASLLGSSTSLLGS